MQYYDLIKAFECILTTVLDNMKFIEAEPAKVDGEFPNSELQRLDAKRTFSADLIFDSQETWI